MRYKLLGKSGLRVSELCFGAMTFGTDWGWGASKEECHKMYNAFRDAGGNFIDTADFYTNGTSETFVGEFIKDHRDQMVLATKFTNSAPGKDPNAAGNHRKNMMQSVEASLKRLQTDYIDLYWLHVLENTTPMEEIMRAFDDLISQGKVLYIGISDAPAWEISRANMMAELKGWSRFIAIQVKYNLLERTVERELTPMAKKLDLGVLAWGPLAGGVLTGKYSKPSSKEKGRLTMKKGSASLDESTAKIADAVIEVAESIGRPPSQVALNWVRQQSGVVIPMVSGSKVSQVEDNLGCLEFKLEEEHIKILNEVSKIVLGFPHDFVNEDQAIGFAFGGMHSLIDNHRL